MHREGLKVNFVRCCEHEAPKPQTAVIIGGKLLI